MPKTDVVFFADDNGSAPLLDWLDNQERKVQDKCLVWIERLEEHGHELRRPAADYLRDGIYELRVRHRSVNYRMLYFFHNQMAVVSHGLTKENIVPDRDIDLALSRSMQFKHDPERHTYKEQTDG
ncbi:MAG: type II toxin-antitoxin system RelE/ParE family toxin [Thermoguttaceae bacterium]|jgi:phage-related protein|nr:type II toxin-antitoxin system RelE/ParE family toxin [Thermoguttaceae bacterium]